VREVEVKAVVPDERGARVRLERAGAALTFAGRLEDRRYDDGGRRMAPRDLVLRLRTYRSADGAAPRAHLDWKGPTSIDAGYKVREEISTSVGDPDALAQILERLGYVVIQEIDRDIAQYTIDGVTVRFENYPRMDVLVEVEGSPAEIERVIAVLGLPRESFTSARLPDFAAQFEARTGQRAFLSDRELTGDFNRRVSNP
jgi:predicted adenylyl cyclase CyaB